MSICCTPLLALSDTSAAQNLISPGSLTRWSSLWIEEGRSEVWSKHKLQESPRDLILLWKTPNSVKFMQILLLFFYHLTLTVQVTKGKTGGSVWLWFWISKYNPIQKLMDLCSPLPYDEAFLSWWEWCFPGWPHPALYKAQEVTEWVEQNENDVNHMPWPSQSPNLNPI